MGYRRKISIHLMFLLIGITLETTCLSCYFNTSHVSINRKAAEDDLLDIRYFNTSHVSINRKKATSGKKTIAISIHLMFLLIRQTRKQPMPIMLISIHLMFLLIVADIRAYLGITAFQYISCFY